MTSYCERYLGLTGRVVVVTGGFGGLGSAMAKALIEAGAKIALIARNIATANAPSEALLLRADVRSHAEVQAAFKRVFDAYGTVTCLINNAGVYLDNRITDKSFLNNWRTLIDTNLTGPAICSSIASEYFIREKYGKIVNIGSAYSTYGHPQSAGYTASKTGVVGLTNALAAELGRNGVRANAVLPGWFETPMNNGVQESPRGQFITNVTPLGRWGTGSDLAGVIVFLCAPASDFISGAASRVDGGYCISDRDYAHV